MAADGGTAHVAVVDALDDVAVNEHVRAVAGQAGSVDVSFQNLVSRGDVQDTPPLDMGVEDYLRRSSPARGHRSSRDVPRRGRWSSSARG